MDSIFCTTSGGVDLKDRCKTRYCGNASAPKKGGKCHSCHSREQRAKNPIRAQWRRLKDKAKRRGINFCLPFWYFRIFAERCEYIDRTGNGAQSLTVDRINNLLGYVIGNIQPMTREQNVRKQIESDEKRYRIGFGWRGAA